MSRRRSSFLVPRALLLILFTAIPAPLWACPICFQFEQGPVTAGMRVAIFVLMGVTATALPAGVTVTVTAGVLTGFGMFIRRFVRRARR